MDWLPPETEAVSITQRQIKQLLWSFMFSPMRRFAPGSQAGIASTTQSRHWPHQSLRDDLNTISSSGSTSINQPFLKAPGLVPAG